MSSNDENHNDIYLTAKAKKEAENEAFISYERTVEKAKNLWIIVWAIISICIAGTVWTTKIQMNVTTLQSEGEKRDIKIDKVESTSNAKFEKVDSNFNVYKTSNDLAIVLLNNTVTGNKLERMNQITSITNDIASLKLDTPKVNEMYFLMQHGVSFKENFVLQHGYAPPMSPSTNSEIKENQGRNQSPPND